MSHRWNRNDIEKKDNYAQSGKFYRCASVPFTSTETASSRGSSGHKRGFTESTVRVTDKPRRIRYGPFVVLSCKKNYIGGHDSSCYPTNWDIERAQDKELRPGRMPHYFCHGEDRKKEKNARIRDRISKLTEEMMTNQFYINENKVYINDIYHEYSYGLLKRYIRDLSCAYADMTASWRKIERWSTQWAEKYLAGIEILTKVINDADEEVSYLEEHNRILEKRNRCIEIEIETFKTRLR